MKKFKRIIINAISFVIAILLLISPLDVLAGTANTTNVIESFNKYVAGDSVFYLSHADMFKLMMKTIIRKLQIDLKKINTINPLITSINLQYQNHLIAYWVI